MVDTKSEAAAPTYWIARLVDVAATIFRILERSAGPVVDLLMLEQFQAYLMGRFHRHHASFAEGRYRNHLREDIRLQHRDDADHRGTGNRMPEHGPEDRSPVRTTAPSDRRSRPRTRP